MESNDGLIIPKPAWRAEVNPGIASWTCLSDKNASSSSDLSTSTPKLLYDSFWNVSQFQRWYWGYFFSKSKKIKKIKIFQKMDMFIGMFLLLAKQYANEQAGWEN